MHSFLDRMFSFAMVHELAENRIHIPDL